MDFIEVAALNLSQEKGIHQLWNSEYPIDIRHNGLVETQSYLNKLVDPHHVLYVETDIQAWYCDFNREDRRFFVMIVARSAQKKGIGSLLLNRAKTRNSQLFGWVVVSNMYQLKNGGVYNSPLDFYKKNDFLLKPESKAPSSILKTKLISWSA